ncbi:Six-hairpin glycosidase-like protein [Phlyctochytrium arcticum]|nr:Six-hairpin glycosidase-like protein [Phlyctochytrium arcticum]
MPVPVCISTPDVQSLLPTPESAELIVHNAAIAPLLKHTVRYSKPDIQHIWDVLNSHHSLTFPTVDGRKGLFKAAVTPTDSADSGDYTGYDNVWVRDNIHVAHAHLVNGQPAQAVATITDLAAFWLTAPSLEKWTNCITHSSDFDANVMLRPHIRFNGTLLQENAQTWAHAQNDAIGYFLWLASKLILGGFMPTETNDLTDLLALIPMYFHAIRFEQDKDSGHWEEARKVEASSLGPVVAGLDLLSKVLATQPEWATRVNSKYAHYKATLNFPAAYPLTFPSALTDLVATLHQTGTKTLHALLPRESIDRSTDAALLFLLYPLNLPLPLETTETILTSVIGDLAGPYGIRRYAGDSYWMADYKTCFSEESRTADFSTDMNARDKFLRAGQEAQWCIFDSILACIYAQLAIQHPTRAPTYTRLQTHFFNRALGQITGSATCPFGDWHCPESYYIEAGKYVTNDVCPLLWTRANLVCALRTMLDSAPESVVPNTVGHLEL